MHYGLSDRAFSEMVSQASQANCFARIFLRFACYTTAIALNPLLRVGQFIF